MKEAQYESQEKISLYTEAESLREKYPNDKEFIFAVGIFLHKHGFAVPERYEPKSILESRFISAEEAFEKGVLSCGAVATMSAAMLRHVGLKVQLVHGEWSGSVDHAWISVLDQESGEWIDYDLTRSDPFALSTHVVKTRTETWEDIREMIESDHATHRERSIARRDVLRKGE